MNSERAVAFALAATALIGLTFIGLAVLHALSVGNLLSLARHPLLGSGAASLSTAALGTLVFLSLRRWR